MILILLFVGRFDLMERYDYITNVMKIDNQLLLMTPSILRSRFFVIKERHGFLRKIDRAQYDPRFPLYIPLDELCKGTNEEFCLNLAKRPLEEFESYLRTL